MIIMAKRCKIKFKELKVPKKLSEDYISGFVYGYLHALSKCEGRFLKSKKRK
jgi:hypothetical protein